MSTFPVACSSFPDACTFRAWWRHKIPSWHPALLNATVTRFMSLFFSYFLFLLSFRSHISFLFSHTHPWPSTPLFLLFLLCVNLHNIPSNIIYARMVTHSHPHTYAHVNHWISVWLPAHTVPPMFPVGILPFPESCFTIETHTQHTYFIFTTFTFFLLFLYTPVLGWFLRPSPSLTVFLQEFWPTFKNPKSTTGCYSTLGPFAPCLSPHMLTSGRGLTIRPLTTCATKVLRLSDSFSYSLFLSVIFSLFDFQFVFFCH